MSALRVARAGRRGLPASQVCEVVLRARVRSDADAHALRGALQAAADGGEPGACPRGGPLLRVELFRPGRNEQVLLVTIDRTVYALQVEGPALVNLDEAAETAADESAEEKVVEIEDMAACMETPA